MSQNLLELYDSVDGYATKLIFWNWQTHGQLSVKIDEINDKNLWLLNILKISHNLGKKFFYFNNNFSLYLKLKYIKKFKFLKFNYFKKKNYEIDSIGFEEEIAKSFGKDTSLLEDIYNTYYKGE